MDTLHDKMLQFTKMLSADLRSKREDAQITKDIKHLTSCCPCCDTVIQHSMNSPGQHSHGHLFYQVLFFTFIHSFIQLINGYTGSPLHTTRGNSWVGAAGDKAHHLGLQSSEKCFAVVWPNKTILL